MFYIRKAFFYFLLNVLNMYKTFNYVVKNNNINKREKLQNFIIKINSSNSFFKNKFDEFINKNKDVDDNIFFEEFSKLQCYSKDDYIKNSNKIVDNFDKSKELNLSKFFNGIISLMGDFNHSMMTGGSSNKPLRVYMDKYHATRMAFTFFKCWWLMGWRPGNKIMMIYPRGVYDLEGFEKYNSLKYLTGFNIVLFNNLIDHINIIENEINNYKPDLIIIFPSPLNKISKLINDKKINLIHKPKWINVSGETFLDCQKLNCNKAFPQTIIHDSYGSVELGEIAHEDNNKLKVFDNIAYVETIPFDDKKEIIVTIYDHHYFPFVKYKMGDLVEFDGNYIFDINGKSSNRIKLKNGYLYPRDLNKFINDLNINISDIKLILNKDNVLLKLVGTLSEEELKNVENLFYSRFGLECKATCVDIIDHDYRKKYRVIEDYRDDIEYAGGVIDKIV